MKSTDWYEEGRMAYDNGVDSCPYGRGSGDNRIQSWWNGWLDRRTELNLRLCRIKWGDRNQRERMRPAVN